MNSLNITNRQELLLEIERLRLEIQEQSAALDSRFQGPAAIFGTVRSLFRSADPGARAHHEDVFSLLSRVLIPLTLNKTIFSQSGFLVKTLVGLISQKAAGFVNEGSIETMIVKAKSYVEKLFHKPNPNAQI